MRLGGYGIDIRNQLGLRDGQLTTTDQERTEHNNKDPAQLGLLNRSLLLVVPRVKEPRVCVTSALLDDRLCISVTVLQLRVP